MKDKILKNRNRIIICIALILIIFNAMYHVSQKNQYTCDEGLTLSLANGSYSYSYDSIITANNFSGFYDEYIKGDNYIETWINVFLCGLDVNIHQTDGIWYQKYEDWKAEDETVWVSGNAYKDLITVSDNSRFDYLSVEFNQYTDVHPPLYYFLVHTIFSIFTNSYSDWYLFGINIIFLIGACILLYKIVSKFWENKKLALISMLVYGLSAGFVSTASLFRMYAMLTFFVIWLLYQYLELHSREWKLNWKSAILLFINLVLGFYTQYYFIVFAVFLAVIGFFYMIKEKKIGGIISYMTIMVAALGASYLLWPVSVKHIFLSYRGKASMANLIASFNYTDLHNFNYQIVSSFYHSNMLLQFLSVIVILVCLYFVIKRKNQRTGMGVITFAPALLYFVTMVQIAEFQVDRYIMCIFPIIALIISFSVYYFVHFTIKKEKAKKYILYIFFALILGGNLLHCTANYVNKEKKSIEDYVEADEMECICIVDSSWRIATNYKELMEYEHVVVLTPDKLNFLEENPPQKDKTVVIEIQKEFDSKAIIEQISAYMDISPEQIEFVRGDNDYTFTFVAK